MNIKGKAEKVLHGSIFDVERGQIEIKNFCRGVVVMHNALEKERMECCNGDLNKCMKCYNENSGPCTIMDALKEVGDII